MLFLTVSLRANRLRNFFDFRVTQVRFDPFSSFPLRGYMDLAFLVLVSCVSFISNASRQFQIIIRLAISSSEALRLNRSGPARQADAGAQGNWSACQDLASPETDGEALHDLAVSNACMSRGARGSQCPGYWGAAVATNRAEGRITPSHERQYSRLCQSVLEGKEQAITANILTSSLGWNIMLFLRVKHSGF